MVSYQSCSLVRRSSPTCRSLTQRNAAAIHTGFDRAQTNNGYFLSEHWLWWIPEADQAEISTEISIKSDNVNHKTPYAWYLYQHQASIVTDIFPSTVRLRVRVRVNVFRSHQAAGISKHCTHHSLSRIYVWENSVWELITRLSFSNVSALKRVFEKLSFRDALVQADGRPIHPNKAASFFGVLRTLP